MKNIIGIFVLLLLGILVWLMYTESNPLEGIDGNYKDFAIRDTSSVDQIFISEPEGKQVLLTRRGYDTWMVNGEFPARPDGVSLILKTLHDIKIQSTVSKTTLPRVIKRLATVGRKVEFYVDGEKKPEKVWYVGEPTASRVGTYMLLEKDGEKSKRPFITHLLMERGWLGNRFFADQVMWKDRILFKTDPKEIRSIEVIHKYDTATSYRIEKRGAADFILTNLENNESQSLPSDIAIPYFKGFQGIYYEYLDQKTSKSELDSIYGSFPRHRLNIEMMDGKKHQLKTFNMPVKKGAMLGEQPIDYHPERMYIYSSFMGEQNYPIVQNLTFDPLAADYYDFASSTTVEK